MTEEPGSGSPVRQSGALADTECADWGWYLYAITRPSQPGERVMMLGAGLDEREPVRLLPFGDLVAIVGRVPMDEFGPEAIRAQVQDARRLEALVRGHERVVEAVHQQRAVLPAKFGCLYRSEQELAAALAKVHGSLQAQVARLEQCDEWGLALYADRSSIRQRAALENPTVRQLQKDVTEATPGRAYFLQLKLADATTAAGEQLLADLAQACFNRLSRLAIAAQVGSRRTTPLAFKDEIEILRAAFLVRRPGLDRFLAEVRRFVETQQGLRGEYSGPWPPYSFAAMQVEPQ